MLYVFRVAQLIVSCHTFISKLADLWRFKARYCCLEKVSLKKRHRGCQRRDERIHGKTQTRLQSMIGLGVMCVMDSPSAVAASQFLAIACQDFARCIAAVRWLGYCQSPPARRPDK